MVDFLKIEKVFSGLRKLRTDVADLGFNEEDTENLVSAVDEVLDMLSNTVLEKYCEKPVTPEELNEFVTAITSSATE